MDGLENQIQKLSVYKEIFRNDGIRQGKGAMSTLNNVRLKTCPCGTPQDSSCFRLSPSICRVYVYFSATKEDVKSFVKFSLGSLRSKRPCKTCAGLSVSKARIMKRNTAAVMLLRQCSCSGLATKSNPQSMVQRRCQNPAICLGRTSRPSRLHCKRSLLITFPTLLLRLTGRNELMERVDFPGINIDTTCATLNESGRHLALHTSLKN